MKRHHIAICLMITGSALWAQQTNSIAEAMDRYDYDTAITLIEQQPATVDLLFRKAKAQKGLYRYNDAINTLKVIEEQEPENPLVLLEMAECCRLAGNLQEASSYYEKVLALNPTHQYARIQYINLLFSIDKYREARSLCQEMLLADSSNLSMRLLAQCYEGLNQPDSAAVLYNKILSDDPTDFISVTRLGNIYITDEPEMTVKLTENYREKDSLNLYVNRLNAQAHSLSKNHKTAIKRYEHLMSLGDTTRYNTLYLGMSYYADEKFFEAHDYLELALRYDPNNVNILYYLARACANTSWKKEGIEYMKKAIDITVPADLTMARLYAGLGECYFRATEWNNYIDALQTQHKYEPDKHYILYRIGTVYQDFLKDNKNAERYLKMYLSTKPKDMDTEEPVMEGGQVVLGPPTIYKTAERRLEIIREDNFFRGKE